MSRYNTLLQPESKPADRPQQSQMPSAATEPAVTTDAPVGSPVDQPTERSTSQSTALPSGRIVARPKAFYITERLDAHLDEAVRYLQTRHTIRKVDRSTIINALLDQDEHWSQEALDALVDRVLSQLTSRLTG
jgi:hypothetical protein